MVRTERLSFAICQNAYFCHLDAGSTNNNKRYLNVAKAKTGNNLIFWYRYIYSYQKGFNKFVSSLFIIHRIFWESLLYIIKHHDFATVKSCFSGLKFGLSFIRK